MRWEGLAEAWERVVHADKLASRDEVRSPSSLGRRAHLRIAPPEASVEARARGAGIPQPSGTDGCNLALQRSFLVGAPAAGDRRGEHLPGELADSAAGEPDGRLKVVQGGGPGGE